MNKKENRIMLEKKQIEERVQKNGVKYKKVIKLLDYLLKGETNKTDLLKYVVPKAIENGLHIERAVKRNKQILYCWICEHIDIFPDIAKIVNSEWPFEEDRKETENAIILSSPDIDFECDFIF